MPGGVKCICFTNNAAECVLRYIPLGRKACPICGSDCFGRRSVIICTLIQTAKLNEVDPQTWLADVLARIADHPATKLAELLSWNWAPRSDAIAAQQDYAPVGMTPLPSADGYKSPRSGARSSRL